VLTTLQDEIFLNHGDQDVCLYTYAIQNIYSYKFVTGAAIK